MGSARAQQNLATVGGLADLQAEAHKEAFEQGLAEGREAGHAEVRAQVERLSGMFYDLAKPFEVLDAEVERELLTLAMALARQIVRRELKTDPTQIIGRRYREAIAGAKPVAGCAMCGCIYIRKMPRWSNSTCPPPKTNAPGPSSKIR